MGLAQWLHRIKRLTDDEMAVLRSKPPDRMREANILLLDFDTKWQREFCEPILPWLRAVTRTSMEYDYDKMLEAIGAPKNAYPVGWGEGVVEFSDRKGGRWTFSSKALHTEDCMKKVRRRYGVCWYAELRYWRKAYDIHEAFAETLPYSMQSCWYYPLQGEALDKLMPLLEAEGLSRKDVEPTEDSVACYDWCY